MRYFTEKQAERDMMQMPKPKPCREDVPPSDLLPYNVYSFRVRKEDKITLKGSAQKWGK